MKKYFNIASIYLILGLVAGVFFREFTKLSNFTDQTTLGLVHAHTLVLGFIFFIIVMLLDKNFFISKIKSFKAWLVAYNISLVYVLITLLVRGIFQVKGIEVSYFSHIAGLGHALLGISLIWFIVITNKALSKNS